jgi:hypothetical protein
MKRFPKTDDWMMEAGRTATSFIASGQDPPFSSKINFLISLLLVRVITDSEGDEGDPSLSKDEALDAMVTGIFGLVLQEMDEFQTRLISSLNS